MPKADMWERDLKCKSNNDLRTEIHVLFFCYSGVYIKVNIF